MITVYGNELHQLSLKPAPSCTNPYLDLCRLPWNIILEFAMTDVAPGVQQGIQAIAKTQRLPSGGREAGNGDASKQDGKRTTGEEQHFRFALLFVPWRQRIHEA